MQDSKAPDPRRLEVLKQLPEEVVRRLTREELQAFLEDEPWPDSLKEKLKDYLE